ncbi:MAG: Ig-like domain repeat protein [Coprococcus sp.]
MMKSRWQYILMFVVLVCVLSGGVCEGKMLLVAFGAESLEAELRIENCVLGNENFFMEDISLIAEVKGGRGPWQIRWNIRYQLAETGDIIEIVGTCEELQEVLAEYGIGRIEKNKEEIHVVLSSEGSYEVYLSVTDMDGTSMESGVYYLVIDRTAPSVSVSEISEALMGHNIYGRLEIPVISVLVDDQYEACAASGLSQIVYHITDCSGNVTEGYLLQNDEENAAQWQGYLQPDPVKFADGRLEIVVTASDKAGNVNHSQVVMLMTDTREPVVEFEFDTADRLEDKYYSHRKVLQITVEEENFDMACSPVVMTENEGGYTFTGWQQRGAKTTGMIIFSEDGEYGVTFSCKDLAGNSSGMKELMNFIIDKTAPVISVSYDDQQVRNERYYSEKRTAFITVEDHNFREEDGVINIHCDEKEEIPVVGPWTSDGDSHKAQITFEADGSYSLSVDWADPAGNKAEGYRSGTFIIDRTEPELTIEGVSDCSSNNGKVAPEVRIYDENVHVNGIMLSLQEASGGALEIEPMIRRISDEQGEAIIFDDFGPEMDGIYTLKAEAEDLAGNKTFREIKFSVNRGGSSFSFSDGTKKLFEKIFIRQPKDIVIFENNVDWLTDREISVYCNGEMEELSEGQDYRIDVAGSGNTPKQYTYTIPAEYFEKEGVYTIHLYSQDCASNISSNDAVKQKAGFILDSTAPSITVANLEERHYYHEKEHEFTAVITDNTMLESVRYYLDGQLVRTYKKDELEQMDGVLYLKTGSADDYQTIKLEAEDAAGNLSESKEWHILVNATQQTIRQSGWNVQEEENVQRGAVMIVFIGTAVVVGVLGIIWFWVRKQKKI